MVLVDFFIVCATWWTLRPALGQPTCCPCTTTATLYQSSPTTVPNLPTASPPLPVAGPPMQTPTASPSLPAAGPLVATASPTTCAAGPKIFHVCDFSDWTPWDCGGCSSRCGTSKATRLRYLCCDTALRGDPPKCFQACGFKYLDDNIENQDCSTTCGCPSAAPTTPIATPAPTTPVATPAIFTSPPHCDLEGQIIPSCEWTDWEPWDCSSCCEDGTPTSRSRLLCCARTFYPADSKACYTSCHKNELDAEEYDICSEMCPCPTEQLTTDLPETTMTDPTTQLTTTTAPRDCTMGSHTFKSCEFSDWTSWNCSTCCQDDDIISRSRLLCCSGTFHSTDSDGCYTSCHKDEFLDGEDDETCSFVCDCPMAMTTDLPEMTTMTDPTTTTASSDCTLGSETFSPCEFSDWTSWYCSGCCPTNALTSRTRELCCSGTFIPADPQQCYTSCNKNYTADRLETRTCNSVCPCPTTASKTTTTITTTSISTSTSTSTPSCTCPTITTSAPHTSLPTTSATSTRSVPSTITTASTSTQLTTSPTTSLLAILSTKTSTTSTTSTTPTAATTFRKASSDSDSLCYEDEEDISSCRSQCAGSSDWNDCVRSCAKDGYMKLCKIVAGSLFLLGMVLGTSGTFIIRWLCNRRQSRPGAVSPDSLDASEDGRTSEKGEDVTDVSDVEEEDIWGEPEPSYQTPKMVYPDHEFKSGGKKDLWFV